MIDQFARGNEPIAPACKVSFPEAHVKVPDPSLTVGLLNTPMLKSVARASARAVPHAMTYRTLTALPGGMIIVATLREILTVRDVALELRCSIAHVYNVINGKVKNVPRLPTIAIGRRKLIQRETLENWKESNERCDDDVTIPPTKMDAVRRTEEDLYA